MNGTVSLGRRVWTGIVVGVVIAFLGWLIYLSGAGNFLLTAVSGPDAGGVWLPVVQHEAALPSGETAYCYDDGTRARFCEESGFQKTKVLGYILKDQPSDAPSHAVWSCAGSPTTPQATIRVTTNTDDCIGSGVGRYRLGYVFDTPEDVPDAPPIKLTACTRANAVRVVGNGACTDDGFGSEQTLGYVAPAGDQLLSLCAAVQEACTAEALSAFCATTLVAHCGLAAATPGATPTPTPPPTATPTSLPGATPTPTPTPTPPPTVTPTPQPTPTPVVQGSATLFVTSQGYSGILSSGGLGGADQICRKHATSAALPNASQYRAILSDSKTNAKDRFEFTGPISLVNGDVIAQDEIDLWDGSIAKPINVNESGASFIGIVFTGTDANGEKDTGNSTYCGNWSSAVGGVEAGRFDGTDGRWISIYGSGQSTHSCNAYSSLYCIGPS